MSLKSVGCLNHNLVHASSEKPSESPTATFHCETQHISDCGCIHMTTARAWEAVDHIY
jgi:hypothetical protein